MNAAIVITLAAAGFALLVGLAAAAEPRAPNLHAWARAFAARTARLARRLAADGTLPPQTISARVVAAMRFEIEQLAAAAAPDGPERAGQETRLRQACADVALKLASDVRSASDVGA